jgi:hypothetical protein
MLNPFEIKKQDRPLVAWIFVITLLVLCFAALIPLLLSAGSVRSEVDSGRYLVGVGFILVLIVPMITYFVYFVIKLLLIAFGPIFALGKWFQDKEQMQPNQETEDTRSKENANSTSEISE